MSEDLYKTLGIERNAESGEIRKQYLKLSRSSHPDKGGDSEEFKKISRAYEVLSDERSRSIYDQTGQIPGQDNGSPFGMPPGGMGGMGGFNGFPFDIGSMFGMFGEGGPRGQRSSRQRGKAPPKKTTISLSLHDFYHGKTIAIHLQQQRFCHDCQGKGSKTVLACDSCHGSGVVQQLRQMGPMIIQNTAPCDPCQGSGKKQGAPCNNCHGTKFVKRDKTLHVHIKKGSKPGDTIVLEGESSHSEQWTEPGDVLVSLEAAEEETQWVRENDTMSHVVSLTLCESLCGKNITLKGHPGFPDGLVVDIPPGLQNGNSYIIHGHGMTTHTDRIGDCILPIRVEPTELEKKVLLEKKEELRSLFT